MKSIKITEEEHGIIVFHRAGMEKALGRRVTLQEALYDILKRRSSEMVKK